MKASASSLLLIDFQSDVWRNIYLDKVDGGAYIFEGCMGMLYVTLFVQFLCSHSHQFSQLIF